MCLQVLLLLEGGQEKSESNFLCKSADSASSQCAFTRFRGTTKPGFNTGAREIGTTGRPQGRTKGSRLHGRPGWGARSRMGQGPTFLISSKGLLWVLHGSKQFSTRLSQVNSACKRSDGGSPNSGQNSEGLLFSCRQVLGEETLLVNWTIVWSPAQLCCCLLLLMRVTIYSPILSPVATKGSSRAKMAMAGSWPCRATSGCRGFLPPPRETAASGHGSPGLRSHA